MSQADAFNLAIKDAEEEVQKMRDLQATVVSLETIQSKLGKYYGAYSPTMKKLDALKDDILAKRWGNTDVAAAGHD